MLYVTGLWDPKRKVPVYLVLRQGEQVPVATLTAQELRTLIDTAVTAKTGIDYFCDEQHVRRPDEGRPRG